MNNVQYEIFQESIKDTSEAKRGKNLFYKCTVCGDIISSQPKESIRCICGNIIIDADYIRLAIKDYSKFQVLKKKE